MVAIIPAAGKGTRLEPHTLTKPKVMLNVAGRPMLGHTIEQMRNVGIHEIVIIIGYRSDRIKAYVENAFPELIFHYVPQDDPQGLGHAIAQAEAFLTGDPVLIVLGDTLFRMDLKAFLQSKVDTLGVKTVNDPRRFGIAVTEEDKIVQLVEKPTDPVGNLALIGLYFIRSSSLLKECLAHIMQKELKTRGEYQITDALQLMVEQGTPFTAFEVEDWYDCGTVETLLETNRAFLELMEPPPNSYELIDSTLIQPCFIGDGCRISHSVVGPYVSMQKECSLSHSIISNSILDDKVQIQNRVMKDSVVGANNQLAATPEIVSLGEQEV